MRPIRLEGFRVMKQYEDHTCGLCSMSAIYRFYGLSPASLGLRERVGVDNDFKGLIPKGTMPNDMCQVLCKDGFEVELNAGSYEEIKKDLRRYLRAGHPALALVDGIAHWVVVVGMDDDGVSIADSCGYLDPTGKPRHRYTISHEEASDMVSGVILLQRGKRAKVRESNARDDVIQHAKGTGFGLKSLIKSVVKKCF